MTLHERIKELLPCTCGDAYKCRDLIAPDCPYCNYADSIEEYVNELLKESKELKAWKAEAIKVMPPLQEIGKELGLPLGSFVSPQILPKIKELKAENKRLKLLISQ